MLAQSVSVFDSAIACPPAAALGFSLRAARLPPLRVLGCLRVLRWFSPAR